MKALSAFLFTLLVWLAVTWSFDPTAVLVGLVLSAALGFAVRNLEIDEAPVLLIPHRLFWALAYLPTLFLYVVGANLDVAYRVLHPKLPIRPGIVRVRTTLKSPSARVLLANSITLTPGTLSVDLVGDVLYLHRIHVPEQDGDSKTERSLEPLERFLRRIFE